MSTINLKNRYTTTPPHRVTLQETVHRIICLCVGGVLAWASSLPVCAQTRVPAYHNDYLKQGVGARAIGMGNAQVAATNDETAAFWNPAGLVDLKNEHALGFMHAQEFGGALKYDYLGFVTRLRQERRLAFTLLRQGSGQIPNTLNLVTGGSIDYDQVTGFSAADYAFMASFAQEIKKVKGLSAGVTLKLLYQRVGNFGQAWGFGFDAGLLYRRKNWRVGLQAADLSHTFNAWSFNTETFSETFSQTGQPIPQNAISRTLPSLNTGFAYTAMADKPINVTIALDNWFHFDGPRNVLLNTGNVSWDPRLGVEVGYNGWVFVRAGLMQTQKVLRNDGTERVDVTPTAGIGFRYKSLGVDYAIGKLNGFSTNLASHLFSISLHFDALKL